MDVLAPFSEAPPTPRQSLVLIYTLVSCMTVSYGMKTGHLYALFCNLFSIVVNTFPIQFYSAC